MEKDELCIWSLPAQRSTIRWVVLYPVHVHYIIHCPLASMHFYRQSMFSSLVYTVPEQMVLKFFFIIGTNYLQPDFSHKYFFNFVGFHPFKIQPSKICVPDFHSHSNLTIFGEP